MDRMNIEIHRNLGFQIRFNWNIHFDIVPIGKDVRIDVVDVEIVSTGARLEIAVTFALVLGVQVEVPFGVLRVVGRPDIVVEELILQRPVTIYRN